MYTPQKISIFFLIYLSLILSGCSYQPNRMNFGARVIYAMAHHAIPLPSPTAILIHVVPDGSPNVYGKNPKRTIIITKRAYKHGFLMIPDLSRPGSHQCSATNGFGDDGMCLSDYARNITCIDTDVPYPKTGITLRGTRITKNGFFKTVDISTFGGLPKESFACGVIYIDEDGNQRHSTVTWYRS